MREGSFPQPLMSYDALDPLEQDEDFDLRSLEEILGGHVEHDDRSEAFAIEVEMPDDRGDEAVDLALADVEADTHRTGQPVGPDELNRAAMRHRLSISD